LLCLSFPSSTSHHQPNHYFCCPLINPKYNGLM
jgi:hypothetical protein